jgi:hypothetical protein
VNAEHADRSVGHPARRFSRRDDSNLSRSQSGETSRGIGLERALGELGGIDRTDPGPENCQEIGS